MIIKRLEDLWTTPAMTLMRAGQSVKRNYAGGEVTYTYNSHGYRTREFRDLREPYVLALGCSHTEGEALHRSWCDILQDTLGHDVINLGVSSSDASMIRRNLAQWFVSDMPRPRAVIVQWPDPARTFVWADGAIRPVNNHSRNRAWNGLLQSGEMNFDLQWLDSVVTANRLCRDRGVIIVNVGFVHTLPAHQQEVFRVNHVEMHLNSLTSKHIWEFDNGALDRSHHSEHCHRQWARRIHRIMLTYENSPR